MEKKHHHRKGGFPSSKFDLILWKFGSLLVLHFHTSTFTRGQQTIDEGFLRQTGGVSAKAN